ncbi:hypothetical protein DER46DRAFT_610229 [Fusarium sp. MPI-SDFR-AT-0072]|nr:hypothetical protein DER46DRAFT_610229 [Fusarium sp. MPI-SDFR-AT-0072]
MLILDTQSLALLRLPCLISNLADFTFPFFFLAKHLHHYTEQGHTLYPTNLLETISFLFLFSSVVSNVALDAQSRRSASGRPVSRGSGVQLPVSHADDPWRQTLAWP